MKGHSKFYSVLAVTATLIAMSGCDSDGSSSCLVNADCGDTSVYRCDSLTSKCVEISPKHCSNKVKDSDETDVDCGGSCPTKCDVAKSCEKNTDCASDSCDNATHKCVQKSCAKDEDCGKTAKCFLADESKGYCVSCSNGVADGDETDIDCGGSCSTKCANGKKCLQNSDCTNGTCSNNVCTGDAPLAADVTKLVINEVMSEPDKNKPFALQSSGTQCDFIEIVNKLDKNQSLDGLTLNIVRTDKTDTQSHKLTGVVPAKGAVVVLAKDCAFKAPDGVVTSYHAKTDGNFLTGSPATYELSISDASGKEGPKVNYKSAKQGFSSNRTPDRDPNAEFAKHDDVSEFKYANSPGYCANGGLFIDDCKVVDTCNNNKKDGDETDIDCGGSRCKPCQLGGHCKVASDCATGKCSEEGLCIEKPCTNSSQCGEGYVCDEETKLCKVAQTCTDGIKNQDESDVDCGGVCGGCDNGKACKTGADCKTGVCESSVCTGEMPQPASVSKMVINEVMSEPDKNKPFALQSSGAQCDFVEIVSTHDKPQSLDGLTLNIVRTDKTDTQSHKLTGVLPANGAVVVLAKDCALEVPDGVAKNVHSRSDGNFLTGSPAKYELSILDASGNKGPSVNYETTGKGSSANRNPDINSSSELAKHDGVSEFKYANSPGYCANGGLFIEKCQVVNTCNNDQKDGDETDVDCGGSRCKACDLGKQCKVEGDCATGACSEGRCTEKSCTKASDCGDGYVCDTTTSKCKLEETCSDGIKNQNETDVDCGGSCQACANTKACKQNSDCLSFSCEGDDTNKVCTGKIPEKADVTKLFVNEVMGSPKSGTKFDVLPDVDQVEFVEILNATKKRVMLDGLNLVLEKCKSDAASDCSAQTPIPLSGAVDIDSFIVVSQKGIHGMPIGTANITGLSAITNDVYYKVYVVDGTTNDKSPVAVRKPLSSANGKSQNRANEKSDTMTGEEELIWHSDVSIYPPAEGKESCVKKNSPGFCANGGIYSFGCAVDPETCKPTGDIQES